MKRTIDQIFLKVFLYKFYHIIGSTRRENDLNSSQHLRSKDYGSINNWKNSGFVKLEEAMRRLNLDDHRIKSKNLTNFGIDFLLAEKSKVKAELKKYDNDFLEMFHRLPNRNEKEVMRPLYMYYKNLKNSIDFKHNSDKSSGSIGSATYSRQNTNGSIKSTSSISSTSSIKKPDSNNNMSNIANLGTNNEVSSNVSGLMVENINLGSNTSVKEQRRFSSASNNSNMYSNNSTYNNFVYGKDSKDVKENTREKRSSSASSASSISSLNGDSKGSDIISFDDKPNGPVKKYYNISKEKKLTKSELIGFEKELDTIKKEQSELKHKLHAYQKEFYEVHNRRVKYYKDIIGIEYEYQKYKENKNKIKEIEDILAPYKKAR
jgi:hypothetical protein